MEMVAAAKLRRFQDMMMKARPFTAGLELLLKRVSRGSLAQAHPFIQKRDGNRVLLIVITSDAGLCGSYNQDLISITRRFIAAQPVKPELIGVGKMGIAAFKAGHNFRESLTDLRASRIEEVLTALKTAVEKIYLAGEADAVYVTYSHFKNVTSYQAVTEKLLPFEPPVEADAAAEREIDYIFEPSPEIIFQRLIPLYFEAKMRTLFLEAIVSEQIARMTAMHQATGNAKEMIDTLVLLRNKARQAAITKEIIEIVSGSRAQKLM
jgi:F-type H+-transporting ATPase subunit gamma